VLLPGDGMGELSLIWPTLAALTRARTRVVLIAPPYRPHAPAWVKAGIVLDYLQVVHAAPRDALWAAEQCLRSSACGAVLCWPTKADDRALRRLQTAAEAGQCLGFVYRDACEARNPSPAALRLLVGDGDIRVLKCKGGLAPAQSFALAG
jgi:cell division inhibitor SulA